MSEFDEALAQAVEDGVARGGLPGAAEAVRRGRRRSLRARGGAAVLGIAAIGGAFGVTAVLGGPAAGARPVTAAGATTSPTTGRSASAPTSATESAAVPAHGDGLLAPDLWPGYAEVRWPVQLLTPTHAITSVGSVVQECHGPVKTVPVTGMTMWANGLIHNSNGAMATETVYTFADEKGAAAYLADARGVGSAPTCDPGPYANVYSPGISTAYGVSWSLHQQDSGIDGRPAINHHWLVQSGNRVALLDTERLDKDFPGTNDAKVLADLLHALEK